MINQVLENSINQKNETVKQYEPSAIQQKIEAHLKKQAESKQVYRGKKISKIFLISCFKYSISIKYRGAQ